jgi:hypothetical protein
LSFGLRTLVFNTCAPESTCAFAWADKDEFSC